MTLNDLLELHMLAWVLGGLCLYAYVLTAQLNQLIGVVPRELR